MNPEIIIIGSGVAALQTAIEASRTKKVCLITKSRIRDSNSYLAQGGIAVAVTQNDHPDKHLEDTIRAGSSINNPLAVAKLVQGANQVITEITNSGMKFDRDHNGEFKLGMEGAHSERRILHSRGDQTGKHLVEHFLEMLSRTTVQVLEETAAIELLIGMDGSCIGVKTVNRMGAMECLFSPQVVLATGGCGSLYSLTSNSPAVSGDGIALALRAGARVKDMEFIQFHPTLLYIDGKAQGLVTEAIRGEGAKLVTKSGGRIMEGVHPQKELAPRHIVAQTIFSFMQKGQAVYLDISMIPHFTTQFPTVTEMCRQKGIQLEKGRIPVAPGNHFLMGGVETDELGRTSMKGLYAVGEVACNGVHGANRLASNSLLEGLVFGKELGTYLAKQEDRQGPNKNVHVQQKDPIAEKPVNLPAQAEIQDMLMQFAGICRSASGLITLLDWLESFNISGLLDVDVTILSETEREAVNGILVAWLIAEAALIRTESRGGHFRSDTPEENDQIWLGQSLVFDRDVVKATVEGRNKLEQIKA